VNRRMARCRVTVCQGNSGCFRSIPQCDEHRRADHNFNLIEGAHQAARAGLGAAVLPSFVADRDPELQRLTEPEAAGDFGVWVLTHPDLRRSANQRLHARNRRDDRHTRAEFACTPS